MLATWALQYWLCDDPIATEWRPGPTRTFENKGACRHAAGALPAAEPASAAIHCKLVQQVTAAVAPKVAAVVAPKATPAKRAPICPGDQIVSVNLHSQIYHVVGSRWFRTTRSSKLLCRKDADREGGPRYEGQ